MPWEGSQIFIASCVISPDVSILELHNTILVAGHPAYESVAEPNWSPSNDLLFPSGFDGYRNAWIAPHWSDTEVKVEPVSSVPILEDFGELDWILGLSS